MNPSSGKALRAVEDTADLNDVLTHAINSQPREARKDEFTSARLPPGAPPAREQGKRVNRIVDSDGNAPHSFGTVSVLTAVDQ